MQIMILFVFESVARKRKSLRTKWVLAAAAFATGPRIPQSG